MPAPASPSTNSPRHARRRTPGRPAGLLRQRALLEPVEQRHAERRRSPAPAGSGRGCRPGRAAPARRAGRRPGLVRVRRHAARRTSPRAAITPSRDQQPAVVLGAQRAPGNGSSGVSRNGPRNSVTWRRHATVAPGARRLVARSDCSRARPRPRPRSWPGPCRPSAGRPIGVVIAVDRGLVVPVGEQGRAEARPLRRRADQADRPEVRRSRSAASQSATSSAWSCVITSTWCPSGSSPSTSSGSTARGARATAARRRRRAAASRSAASCVGTRVDQVQVEVVAGPGSGPAPARRARRRRPPPPARTGSGSSSTVTSPPQHCTPCSPGALSTGRRERHRRAARRLAASSSRARATAVASRLPPPTLPHVASAATTIFAPASRGAWPRTDDHVTSTPGAASPAQLLHRLSQSMVTPHARSGASTGPPAVGSADAAVGRRRRRSSAQ